VGQVSELTAVEVHGVDPAVAGGAHDPDRSAASFLLEGSLRLIGRQNEIHIWGFDKLEGFQNPDLCAE
jgi:hypothetical protein